jgi:hypothetical protein
MSIKRLLKKCYYKYRTYKQRKSIVNSKHDALIYDNSGLGTALI